MSMFSAIDAEHDKKIVKEALEAARAQLVANRTYTKEDIEVLLEEIMVYCEVNISE